MHNFRIYNRNIFNKYINFISNILLYNQPGYVQI